MKNHCSPRNVRNLLWNWTKNGEVAIQVCPPGSSGFAKWKCGLDDEWATPTPNLGECQSMWLSRLESKMHRIGSIDSISSELAALTQTKSLYGGDIPIVISIIQGLADRLRQELLIITSKDEEEMKVSELLQNVMKTASNILGNDQRMAWLDLPEEKRSSFATNLLLGLEENALLLAEVINDERNLIEATNNVLASLRIMRARDAGDQIFPHLETVKWEEDTKMQVPASSLLQTSVDGAVRLIFFLHKNMHDILPSNGSKFINSKIVGASVAKGRYFHISVPILFTLKHLRNDRVGNSVCAAWNFSGRKWETKDCSVLRTNSTHTTCQCKRISHYAVLSENVPEAAAEPHAASDSDLKAHLSTIIACVVAVLLAIVIVIIIFLLVRRFDLKPRMQKFAQANGVFRCKKSDSTTSSCGFYPPLTSSPTSTTVSGGTPTNQTYLEQVLKAHNAEYQQQQQINKPQTLHPNSSSANQPTTIYRTSNLSHIPQANGRHLVALNQCDPFGHHIYMEIDPVYAHLEANSGSSDIHLSDISDDDLRRNNQRLAAEERPLIRHQLGIQHLQAVQGGLLQSDEGHASPHSFLTAHRVPRGGGGSLSSSFNNNNHAGNNSLRNSRTAHKTRPRIQQQPLLYPVVNPRAGSTQGNIEAPITIALQGGEQFVSLKIDKQKHLLPPQQERAAYH